MYTGEAASKLPKIALWALGILLLGAIVFYKERIFFGDASFIVFNIINNHRFEIQEHRYGSFVTQVIPYLGQALHVPLKAIIIGYGISFNLFYLLVGVALYRCRQYGLSILMALYYVLFVSDSYFWTNNEIHQAVAWMFLMFGVTAWCGIRKINIIVTTLLFGVLAFLTVFTHFVVIIPALFLWVYLLIGRDNWPYGPKANIAFSTVLVAVMAWKYLITAEGSYDGSHLHGVTHFSFKDVWHSFGTPVVTLFLHRCVTRYWVAALVFMPGIFALFAKKKIGLAVWSIVSLLGYLAIMGLTYGDFDGNFALFHIESEWQSIGIIISAPFVFNLLPSLEVRYAGMLLVFVIAVRLAYIGAVYQTFLWRTHFKSHVLAEMKRKNIKKLILLNDNYLMNKNILYWALPEESMMMSEIDGDKPQALFLFVNPDNKDLLDTLTTNRKVLGMSFSFTLWYNLNSHYFQMDTTLPYVIMTHDELEK